ncbi:hypothetical protein RHMOL_Rhmol09G0100300 [Rhododendron molle]|uniref:Uncharacterized protein n=1 Tax=Rhododendron molle TaxID=49168 RepID=A0ACC0MBR2_RHOML|nr:hypothetical protein RHMOL_Rhmol09G0100300 [Rhododendron molle]
MVEVKGFECDGSEGFVVTQFLEGHSHPLTTPRKRHFLRSHRRVLVAQKALTQQLAAANVSTSQQMTVLELHAGGLENVGCLRRDIYNSRRDTRKYLDGHDANMLKEYFETEKDKNPGTEVVREALLSSQKKIALMRSCCQDSTTSSIQLPISLGSQHGSGLKEPLKVRAKGCGKRLKGGKEKAVKKSRKCHGCGLTGQSHDKRNCPMLMNMMLGWMMTMTLTLHELHGFVDMEMKLGRHIETEVVMMHVVGSRL